MPEQKTDLKPDKKIPYARIQDDFKAFHERFDTMRNDDVFISADKILGTDFDGNYRDEIRIENAEKKAVGESLKSVTDYYQDFSYCFSIRNMIKNVQKNFGV
jgi:hypothetical protein